MAAVLSSQPQPPSGCRCRSPLECTARELCGVSTVHDILQLPDLLQIWKTSTFTSIASAHGSFTEGRPRHLSAVVILVCWHTSSSSRSLDESTIHPATRLLVQALQDLVQSAGHANEQYSHLLDSWASKLEEDAEMIRQGEKGAKYMFLLNNTCGVSQMMRRPEATFANEELRSRLDAMIQRYTKSYIDECWVPLNNTLHLNLDEFTAEFLATCGNQMTWKVAAELRYQLREEIVDFIVPPYEVSLSALQANRNQLSGRLYLFRRVIAGKKKQKKYTGEELKEKIRVLFEG